MNRAHVLLEHVSSLGRDVERLSRDQLFAPARDRQPMTFLEVYLGQVVIDDFRKNARGELGTRTATLHKEGIKKLRQNWIFRL